MRIAVVADTHDRLPEHVRAAIAGADEIWHLGDVCAPALLAVIEQLGPPVRVVRGNCDATMEWPETLDFTIGQAHVRLMHVPPGAAPPGVDLLLHGHTHVPRNELLGSTRFLNPGCITRPNRGAPASFAWLTLEDGKVAEWVLERV